MAAVSIKRSEWLPPRPRPRRLAWPRTSPFHGGNTGSNPVGDANKIKQLQNDEVLCTSCVRHRRSLTGGSIPLAELISFRLATARLATTTTNQWRDKITADRRIDTMIRPLKAQV